VNNLPKVVTLRCLEQDLNPQPTDREPKCLAVAPPRHLGCCIHLGALAQEEFYQVQNSLCVQVLRYFILAALLLHGTRAVGVHHTVAWYLHATGRPSRSTFDGRTI